MAEETYIPSPRNATVGYFGRNGRGVFRSYCVRCNDAAPLTDATRIYGGKPGTGEVEGNCDVCGVTFDALSAQCQREHDEQQAKWSRESRIDHVIEMGCVSGIRCRVY